MPDNEAFAVRLMKGEREELKFGDWHLVLSFDARFITSDIMGEPMKPFRGYVIEEWRGGQTKVREELFSDIDKAVERWHEMFEKHAMDIAMAAFRIGRQDTVKIRNPPKF